MKEKYQSIERFSAVVYWPLDDDIVVTDHYFCREFGMTVAQAEELINILRESIDTVNRQIQEYTEVNNGI